MHADTMLVFSRYTQRASGSKNARTAAELVLPAYNARPPFSLKTRGPTGRAAGALPAPSARRAVHSGGRPQQPGGGPQRGRNRPPGAGGLACLPALGSRHRPASASVRGSPCPRTERVKLCGGQGNQGLASQVPPGGGLHPPYPQRDAKGRLSGHKSQAAKLGTQPFPVAQAPGQARTCTCLCPPPPVQLPLNAELPRRFPRVASARPDGAPTCSQHHPHSARRDGAAQPTSAHGTPGARP